MSEELKPCPFCGGTPIVNLQMVSGYTFISCSKCRADGPLRSTHTRAVAAWNLRAALKETNK